MASTKTALSANLNLSIQGQAVTFTATVNPSATTGSVTFKNAVNEVILFGMFAWFPFPQAP